MGLSKDSIVLLEQIRTIDSAACGNIWGMWTHRLMNQIDSAIAVSFGLQTP